MPRFPRVTDLTGALSTGKNLRLRYRIPGARVDLRLKTDEVATAADQAIGIIQRTLAKWPTARFHVHPTEVA